MFTKKRVAAAASVALMAFATACGGSETSGGSGATAAKGSGDGQITMGFAQVGAESGWRTANTKSIQDSAKEAGVDLKFSDAQQKQENQIKAIRSYIQQKVDVIAFSPVVESGWDAVLNEAKRAKIPVILTDRAVDSKDTSALQDLPRLGLRQGGQQGRRVGRQGVRRRERGQHRRAAGHDRLAPRRSTASRASPTSSPRTRSSRSRSPRPVSSRARRARRSWRPS